MKLYLDLTVGANAALLLGRATLYGLAAAGEAGVDHVLRLLKDEVDRTLAQIGCASASQLSPDYLMVTDRCLRPRRDNRLEWISSNG